MKSWRFGWVCALAFALLALIGCADNPAKLRYLGKAGEGYYKEAATEINYAAVESCTVGEVMATQKPRAVNDRREDDIRDLTLSEAMHLAIQNSTIIRSTAQLNTPGNRILSGPDQLPSIYDPAIQESGVLFGGRGMESALSAFDPTLTTSMTWGRNEQVQNNAFFAGGLQAGNTLTQETGMFSSGLQKVFANGSSFGVTHNWNYQGTNAPGQLFPTAYTGNIGANFQMPLLAGAGTEFTRIAGPIAQSFGGITGVNQGVVITRINQDLSLADFELSVRNLLKDVEDTYWDLSLQYRLYDTAVSARNSTLEIWRQLKKIDDAGGKPGYKRTDLLQAREQYFETRAATDTALGNIYRIEVQLRRLIGLPSNDGQVLRPADEPPLAEFIPDWEICLVEALTARTELRRQKFNIKSLELQLKAAHSLTRPRLDFLSGYQVNGFGDKLLNQNDNDGAGTAQGLNSAYETITQGDQTGWNLGLQMTMNLGFRSAHAQVRNIELRLAKARDVLATQELDVSHELSIAFQDLATNYATAQANFNRTRTAEERVNLFSEREEIEDVDLKLRARLSRATSEADFYRSMNSYVKAITAFHYAKGDLLEFNNVQLAESLWTPNAYNQAVRRAVARSHAIGNPFVNTEPVEFVYPAGEHHITVDPGQHSGEAVPQLDALPGEIPAHHPPTLNSAPLETIAPPEPAIPLPAPVPAYEDQPKPKILPQDLPSLPLKEETKPDKMTGFGPGKPSASTNLARLRARYSDSENKPGLVGVTGTKMGVLKPEPKSSINQAGFFENHDAPTAGDSIELNPVRDLLP